MELTKSELSFLIDLMDCTIEKGSQPEDIPQYEKWNSVNASQIYKKIWGMYDGNPGNAPSSSRYVTV